MKNDSNDIKKCMIRFWCSYCINQGVDQWTFLNHENICTAHFYRCCCCCCCCCILLLSTHFFLVVHIYLSKKWCIFVGNIVNFGILFHSTFHLFNKNAKFLVGRYACICKCKEIHVIPNIILVPVLLVLGLDLVVPSKIYTKRRTSLLASHYYAHTIVLKQILDFLWILEILCIEHHSFFFSPNFFYVNLSIIMTQFFLFLRWRILFNFQLVSDYSFL